jgi:RecA/RadA recombinase
LLQVQLPRSLGGLHGSAVYVATELFSDKRLRQLLAAFPHRHVSLDRVFVQSAHSLDELNAVLTQLPLLMRLRSVRLVVVDSIASLFRAGATDGESTAQQFLFERSNFLFSFARRLRALADEFGAAIVVTNQVADAIATDNNNNNAGAPVYAALGPSWSACVTTRLALRKASGPAVAMSRSGARVERKRARIAEVVEGESTSATVEATRYLSVSLSPTLECGTEMAVGIGAGGLFGAATAMH